MSKTLFYKYFQEWVEMYKCDSVADITLRKYLNNIKQLKELAPNLVLEEITRRDYQKLLNDFSQTHEKSTTMDFHHQVKGCLQDAFHERIIERDPTYKAIIKGKIPTKKKQKFLDEEDFKKLLAVLEIYSNKYDLIIFLLAKTGARFAEVLGLTKNDFYFDEGIIDINKTWNYKTKNGNFAPTKNPSSVRKIKVDDGTMNVFKEILNGYEQDEPFFVKTRVFNSTVNNRLENKCKEADVEIITAHALRHTHASILLNAGVSIQSIADRLGHANTTTTQQTYLHIIKELEEKDHSLILQKMEAL